VDTLTRKQQFTRDYDGKTPFISHIVTAVRLPNGSTEIIINSYDLENKYFYIISTYDKDLRMYTNRQIEVVDWMIV
jgi:hypothetical protein